MLRILLKHVVAEVAIHTLFDTLFNNFVKPALKEKIRRNLLGANFVIEKREINVSSRVYRGPPINIVDDKYMHGIDINDMMMEALKYEIQEEIAREDKEVGKRKGVTGVTLTPCIQVYRDINPHPDVSNAIDLIYPRKD